MFAFVNGRWTDSETEIARWESQFATDDARLMRLALPAWSWEVGPVYFRVY